MNRAEVVLWAWPASGSPPFVLVRGETDWQGIFTLGGVRPCKAAWIEVNALYYLGFRGPRFPIPAGEEVEIAPITLQFGGSIDCELLDGERGKLTNADVRLTCRSLGGQVRESLGRTDSRGSLLLGGIAPGAYTIEILNGNSVVATMGGLWIRANAPTAKMKLRLDENSVTFPQAQDPQQFRVYRAEKILSIDDLQFSSLNEIQDYVDRMLATRWWRSSFPEVRTIEVREGQEGDPARGGADPARWTRETTPEAWGSGCIELPRWAWRELVALHEIAHVVSSGSGHGQLFARQFHSLVHKVLGREAALELARAFAAEGVVR